MILNSQFKPEVLFLICCHFEYPPNKFFYEIEIIFVINQLQTMQRLHLLKNIL